MKDEIELLTALSNCHLEITQLTFGFFENSKDFKAKTCKN
jgi:hypothetical protein